MTAPRSLLHRLNQRKQAVMRTQRKNLSNAYKSKSNRDPDRALERAGVWAVGSLFLDDLDRLLASQDASLGLHWGPPEPGMKSIASLYLQKRGGIPEVFQILMSNGRYPDISKPGDLTSRLFDLLDAHKVEIGIRRSHGIPVVQLADRMSSSSYALIIIEAIYGKRVLYAGQQ